MVQLYLECICVLLRYTVCAIFHYSCESGKATHFKHFSIVHFSIACTLDI